MELLMILVATKDFSILYDEKPENSIKPTSKLISGQKDISLSCCLKMSRTLFLFSFKFLLHYKSLETEITVSVSSDFKALTESKIWPLLPRLETNVHCIYNKPYHRPRSLADLMEISHNEQPRTICNGIVEFQRIIIISHSATTSNRAPAGMFTLIPVYD